MGLPQRIAFAADTSCLRFAVDGCVLPSLVKYMLNELPYSCSEKLLWYTKPQV